MPKMKTNRLAAKKFKVTRSGKVKRARAMTSHNTGKKSAARMRKLRGTKVIDKTNVYAIKVMLPSAGIR